ncbi:hypothetical protein GCM10009117_22960 [Gangjinia marincola]|uniref:PASTA domain-containing protein n=1 Tax=Gangjinia marincola TaxID=578463 RepID=A0ABP3XXS8_9FLAO
MRIIQFLKSKTFFIQIGIALIILFLLIFLVLKWLSFTTNHDQKIEVPDLAGFSTDIAAEKLREFNLRYEVLDSANYNPSYPQYAVVEQVPKPGSFVKEDRKIYLTLNPSGYRDVEIPIFMRQSRRQVEPTLIALGLKIGEVTKRPDFAKDAVLGLYHNGEKLKSGDKLMKTSTIDIIIGDGSQLYKLPQSTDTDTSSTPQE